MKKRILVVDDNPEARFTLQSLLESHGYSVEVAGNGLEALKKAIDSSPSIVLMDVVMPEMDGLEALNQFRQHPKLRDTPIVLLTSLSDVKDIRKGLAHGATDYIRKPFDQAEILSRIEAVFAHVERAHQVLERLAPESERFGIVGSSAPMQELFANIEQFSRSDSPVLILGESGTGKELIASALHHLSGRKAKRFLAVNCGAFAAELLESELFGHSRGAFSGAVKDKKGLFEAAEGGSLFLDELGELELRLQPKLLRVLQEGAFLPVGSTEEISVDVRIIAATHRDIGAMVHEGRFREDLFYRLNVLSLTVPPLRERGEDIKLLVQHFLKRYAQKSGTPVKALSEEAFSLFLDYRWPGNVRELENETLRLALLSHGSSWIPASLVSPHISKGSGASDGVESAAQGSSLKVAVAELEKRMISRVLSQTGGNRSEAARLLDISRSNLLSKIKSYELDSGNADEDEKEQD
ncbi:MAG: sigma-54-dependent Fis family transcriptional regulator [Bdellovibrionales bacterium]|nr:sigma-54-dependent Fis family transcriptional regulator [Bdellovibrionales bacterium]